MPNRTCSRCGTSYASHLIAAAFRNWTDISRRSVHRSPPVCRPCEQTARDKKKRDNRWPTKARDTIRLHVRRLGVPKQDLITVYGWDPKTLAHEAEFQYGNGCSYCGHPYREMGHGPSDITLDIIDHRQPPYYRTNTKWCCQTCNRKKGDRGPEFFELDRQVYETWSRTQTLTATERGMLF